MKDHAFAEDDQWGSMKLDQFLRLGQIDLIRILFPHRKMEHGRPFRPRIPGHEISQGPQGLGAEVASPSQMVVQHLADPAGLGSSIRTIEVIRQSAEGGRIGHLAADYPHFHLRTSKETADLIAQENLHLFD
jgi:hypothetical protein